MTEIYCSKCRRVIIRDDKDISPWICRTDSGLHIYTCIFCDYGVESNTLKAIEFFGDGGIYPLGSKTVQEIINS